MTKAYSKGAKRRARKSNKADLPELAPVDRKQPNGRLRRDTDYVAERDPQKTVIEARKRHSGNKDKDAMRHPAYGEPAGQALMASCKGDEAETLWGTYKALTAAQDNYHRRILGKGLHPKTAKLEMMPDVVEARPDDQPDLRSEDERDRDTVNAWMRWQGHLGCLAAHHRLSIHETRSDQVQVMGAVVDAKNERIVAVVTGQGKRFVEAMRALQVFVDRG
ncbi:hypothetical protein [Dinoroseobacter sp. S375]|uniref:hypothetical protein n=1 Tax=Dinoroseobacter sp. S375 TaxID=3415136 RepID=UPI003C7A53CE